MHEAWSSFGLIIRRAQALRLHRRARGSSTNRITLEYRKRLFWSIYIYDRILSSIFGRPCALNDDDIDRDEAVEANDEDITISSCCIVDLDTFCHAIGLIQYSRLACILGRILRHMYSPAGPSQGMQVLQQGCLGL